MMKLKLSFLILMVVVSGLSNSVRATMLQTARFTEEIRSAVIPSRDTSDFREGAAASMARLDRFEATMSRISQFELPQCSDTSAEAEVIRIAKDRSAHPEIYRELDEQYMRLWQSQVRAPSSPHPQSMHLTEQYRLAWEYLLLRPRGGDDDVPGYGFRAQEALYRIHNDDSIPILIYRFYWLNDFVKFPVESQREQERTIGLLGAFTSERGLEALIQCGIDGNKTLRNVTLPIGMYWDAGEAVRKIVSPAIATQNSTAWSLVIEGYKRNPAKREKLPQLHQILDRAGA